ncbi:MAG: ACT domain-containing protein, partial [Candidatus Lokiarchaeota archaeon]|nr:ACT domain-containing protein [Candidatus Lokiarchaeota archaeon]
FLVGKTKVIAIEMKDKPGGLNTIAKILGENKINIEYLYAFATTKTAILVVQVNQEHVENALKVLDEHNIKQFKPSEIYNL